MKARHYPGNGPEADRALCGRRVRGAWPTADRAAMARKAYDGPGGARNREGMCADCRTRLETIRQIDGPKPAAPPEQKLYRGYNRDGRLVTMTVPEDDRQSEAIEEALDALTHAAFGVVNRADVIAPMLAGARPGSPMAGLYVALETLRAKAGSALAALGADPSRFRVPTEPVRPLGRSR